jgi:hypothetical protein
MSFLPAQAPIPALKSLEAQVAELRDEVFNLADTARHSIPYDYTALHVSLQTAANVLGEAEHVLREASRVPSAA